MQWSEIEAAVFEEMGTGENVLAISSAWLVRRQEVVNTPGGLAMRGSAAAAEDNLGLSNLSFVFLFELLLSGDTAVGGERILGS